MPLPKTHNQPCFNQKICFVYTPAWSSCRCQHKLQPWQLLTRFIQAHKGVSGHLSNWSNFTLMGKRSVCMEFWCKYQSPKRDWPVQSTCAKNAPAYLGCARYSCWIWAAPSPDVIRTSDPVEIVQNTKKQYKFGIFPTWSYYSRSGRMESLCRRCCLSCASPPESPSRTHLPAGAPRSHTSSPPGPGPQHVSLPVRNIRE